MTNEGKMVALAKYLYPMQAQLTRVALEAEGIPCVILNEHQGGLTGNSLIPVEVHVFSDDLEAAKDVLARQQNQQDGQDEV